MTFLRGNRGTTSAEWIAAGALIVLVLIGGAIYTVADGSRTEGTALSGWISGLSVPSVP